MTDESAIVVGGEAYYVARKVIPLLEEYGFGPVTHVEVSRADYPYVGYAFVLVDLCSHSLVSEIKQHCKRTGSQMVRCSRREPVIRAACEALGRIASTPRPRRAEERKERPLWCAELKLLGNDFHLRCARGHWHVAGREINFPENCPTCMKEAPVALITPAKKQDPIREAVALLLHAMQQDKSVESVFVENDGTFRVRRVVVTEEESKIEGGEG